MVAADRKLNGPVANRIRTVAAHDGQQFVGLASGQQRQVAVEQIARERVARQRLPHHAHLAIDVPFRDECLCGLGQSIPGSGPAGILRGVVFQLRAQLAIEPALRLERDEALIDLQSFRSHRLAEPSRFEIHEPSGLDEGQQGGVASQPRNLGRARA